VIIKPGFPECIDDFGVLWFEDVVAGSANWVVADNAADAITKELKWGLGRGLAVTTSAARESKHLTLDLLVGRPHAKVGVPALPSPMGVTSKAASITARPATIPRDQYVLLATAASSIS
jgi:hypothetical protein